MIKRPENWNNVRELSDRPKLPLGAYVCRIKKAVPQSTEWGDQLSILFDISEGEYINYYEEDFKANTNEDKKWKGVLRLWLPKDDGSEKDEFTKSRFKGFVTSVEKSNPGYTWNWDEASLTNKIIGILYRNEEWEYNGKHGWAVRPLRAMSADSVRSGDYTIPNGKPLKGKTAVQSDTYSSYDYSSSTFKDLNDDDGELPF